MKALTLHEPWATLCVAGIKGYETRDWPCPAALIGKEIAIHSAVTIHAYARKAVAASPALAGALRFLGLDLDDLPLGRVLGIVRVVACHSTNSLLWELPEAQEPFGNFDPDRFAWEIRVVERFDTPIPARGFQKLWNWDREAAKAGGA